MEKNIILFNTVFWPSDMTGVAGFCIRYHVFGCIKVYAVRMDLNSLIYFSDHFTHWPSLP